MWSVELASTSEVRLGHHRPMLISVWYAQASLSALQLLAEQQRQRVAWYGTLSIAVRVPKAPGPEASEWIKQTDREFKAHTRGSVVMVMERGLAAIIVRSSLVAASLITTNVMHVVKTLEEAAVKAQSLSGQPPEIVGDRPFVQKRSAFAG